MPYPNARGPQERAQANYQASNTANNGNPGGASNTSFAGGGNPARPQFSDYALRNGGQRPELSRYVAPQLDEFGNPVARDRGGYSYNLPNSAGPYPEYNNFGNYAVPDMTSKFDPFAQRVRAFAGPGMRNGLMANARGNYYQNARVNREARGDLPPPVAPNRGDRSARGWNQGAGWAKPLLQSTQPVKPAPEYAATNPGFLTPPSTDPYAPVY